jgi:O-antigen biosynthesis protein
LSSSQSNPAFSATVVVCTRGRATELDACLQAVARLCYPHFQVLVVENGPPGGCTQSVAKRHGVAYLNSPQIGLSRARNDGARACTTDLVAYIDDDALPHPDWLTALAREFADPLVMAVGGEVLSPATPVPGARDSDPRRQRRVVGPQTPNWFTLTNFGGVGDGGSMCFRRTAFQLWPGFDERLGRGSFLDSAEEHFSFFQLVLRGYRCAHTPDAVVYHLFPQTPAEWKRYNLNNLTNAVAYSALLWAEFPQTRGLLIKHLWNRSFGERSRIRAASGTPQLSFLERLGVIAAGLRLFWRLPKPARSAPLLAGSSPETP